MRVRLPAIARRALSKIVFLSLSLLYVCAMRYAAYTTIYICVRGVWRSVWARSRVQHSFSGVLVYFAIRFPPPSPSPYFILYIIFAAPHRPPIARSPLAAAGGSGARGGRVVSRISLSALALAPPLARHIHAWPLYA